MPRLKLLTTAVLTLGLVAGGATAASAGVTPSPPDQPTVSPNIGLVPGPCPTPTVRTFAPTGGPDQTLSPGHVRPTDCATPVPVVTPFQRETFIVQLASAGNTVLLNRVAATGPVSGIGSDVQLSDTFDRFQLPGVLRQVNVPHTGIAFPGVDLRLCTASVTQVGAWRFAGGTGPFRFASGSGRYQLVGQWWFPRIRGVCSLLFLRGNPLLQNRVQPSYTTVSVVGAGSARV